MMRPYYVGNINSIMEPAKIENGFNVKVMPNPITNQTVIKMEINTGGNYKVEIFNTLGQSVKMFTDSYYQKGVHNLLWSETDMIKNGIYYLQIKGEGIEQNIKLLLNR
jgi:hypothetical protein